MPYKKINKVKFRKALKDSNGIISVLAKRMGTSRMAVYQYINKNKLWDMIKDQRETLVDKAEIVLVKKLKEEDWKAVDKILSSPLAAKRGLGSLQKIEHSGKVQGMKTEVTIKYPKGVEKIIKELKKDHAES